MIKDLIGKPYNINSNPPHTFNCWTLVTHLIPNAPNYSDQSLLSIAKQFKRQKESFTVNGLWAETKVFNENDIVLFAHKNVFTHAGIYLENDRILHAKDNVGVIIEPMKLLKMQFKNIKGYRWLTSK